MRGGDSRSNGRGVGGARGGRIGEGDEQEGAAERDEEEAAGRAARAGDEARGGSAAETQEEVGAASPALKEVTRIWSSCRGRRECGWLIMDSPIPPGGPVYCGGKGGPFKGRPNADCLLA